MSNASKRSEGKAEELGGKIKAGVGKLIGNQRLRAQGVAQQVTGRGKQESAKAAERSKGKLEEVVGAVKNRVGAVIADDELQAKGKLQELKGQARQKANR